MLFLTFTCPSWRARLSSFLFYSWFRLVYWPHLTSSMRDMFCFQPCSALGFVMRGLESDMFCLQSCFSLCFVSVVCRPHRIITRRLESDIFCLQSVFSPWFRLVRPPPSPNYESTGIKHVLSSFLFFSWLNSSVRLPTSRDFGNYKSTGIRNEFCLHSCFSISFVWLGYRPRLIWVITSRLESEPRCLHSCSFFFWSAGLTVYESTGIKYM